MKYSEVLCQYEPGETGDFMYRYNVNDREYIIYSPVPGEISCLELYNFKDITPYELALSIQKVPSDKIELKEFSIEKSCSRENLISYLFDVSADCQKERSTIRCISNNVGYLLYELKVSHKVRNIYQLNPNNKEYQLVFENTVCYASIFEETSDNSVSICWNPVVFSLLEEDCKPSYLLASSNPILCTGIIKKVQDRSARINLCVDKNSMEAFLFFAYYTEYRNIEKKISINYDHKMVTVWMKNWLPITLVRFVSKIQKKCKEEFYKICTEVPDREVIFYQLESAAGMSFITFSNNNIVIDTFLRNIILELNLDDITISDFEYSR